MNLEEQKNKLLKRLDALKLFPNNNEVRILRSRIQHQLERIEKQIADAIVIPIPKDVHVKSPKRSSKLTKYWRYIRLIHDSFPNIPIPQIRKQYSKKRRGKKVSISDAVWDIQSQ